MDEEISRVLNNIGEAAIRRAREAPTPTPEPAPAPAYGGTSGPVDMATLRAASEELAATVRGLVRMLIHTQHQARDLIGMIAPVDEHSAEIVSVGIDRLDSGISGASHAENALDRYLTGLRR